MKRINDIDIILDYIKNGKLYIDPQVKSDNFQHEILRAITKRIQTVEEYFQSDYAIFKIPSKRSKYEKLIDKYCSSNKLLIICSQNDIKKFIRWSNVKFVRYYEYTIFNEKSYLILVNIDDLHIEEEFIQMSITEKEEEEHKETHTVFQNIIRWSLLIGPILLFIYVIYLQVFK